MQALLAEMEKILQQSQQKLASLYEKHAKLNLDDPKNKLPDVCSQVRYAEKRVRKDKALLLKYRTFVNTTQHEINECKRDLEQLNFSYLSNRNNKFFKVHHDVFVNGGPGHSFSFKC